MEHVCGWWRQIRDCLRAYLDEGWCPIPVHPRSKKPAVRDWPELRITENDLDQYWPKGEGIGILLGEPSGDLVDIDLDCAEAVVAADHLLPRTDRIHGRPGSPGSHRWYHATPAPTTAKWCDPEAAGDKATLVELRSTGAQTVVPPSHHESGESLQWESQDAPSPVAPEDLHAAVSQVAVAALIARRWRRGMRHDAALALSGLLIEAGWTEEGVVRLVTAICRAAEDEEEGDRLQCIRDTAGGVRSGDRVTGRYRLEGLVGREVVATMVRWLGVDGHWRQARGGQARQGGESDSETNGRPPQSARIVGYVLEEGGDPWHTPAGEPYLDVWGEKGGRKSMPIRSRACRSWLNTRMYSREGRPLGGQAATDAVELLAGMALQDGPERELHVRLAAIGEYPSQTLYLDLGDPTWRAVEIDREGWRIVAEPPVRFRRSAGVKALPEPVRGGEGWKDFRSLLHDPPEAVWSLLVGYLVGLLRPTGPYPILGLTGEQGSGKSTVGWLLRSVVDPSQAPLRSPSRNEQDLVTAARNNHIVTFDNLSEVPGWLADGLCRIATGGGYSARQLYTDAEEFVVQACRPVILTSIEDIYAREDLADRSLVVRLPVLPDSARRPEQKILRRMEDVRPRLLGAVLDAVVTGLRRLPDVRLGNLPRMADFAEWVVACEPSLPLTEGMFLEYYEQARGDQAASALEGHAVASALIEMLEEDREFFGNAEKLLEALKRSQGGKRRKDFPTGPRKMRSDLDRAAPLLRRAGWEVDTGLPKRKVWIRPLAE